MIKLLISYGAKPNKVCEIESKPGKINRFDEFLGDLGHCHVADLRTPMEIVRQKIDGGEIEMTDILQLMRNYVYTTGNNAPVALGGAAAAPAAPVAAAEPGAPAEAPTQRSTLRQLMNGIRTLSSEGAFPGSRSLF